VRVAPSIAVVQISQSGAPRRDRRYVPCVTRGDCERAVAAAARVDGIDLVPVGRTIGWLTQRGHLDLPENLSEPRERVAAIFEALSGDLTAQAAKRSIPLPGDLIPMPFSYAAAISMVAGPW
jgi:hypothetical protein